MFDLLFSIKEEDDIENESEESEDELENEEKQFIIENNNYINSIDEKDKIMIKEKLNKIANEYYNKNRYSNVYDDINRNLIPTKRKSSNSENKLREKINELIYKKEKSLNKSKTKKKYK